MGGAWFRFSCYYPWGLQRSWVHGRNQLSLVDKNTPEYQHKTLACQLYFQTSSAPHQWYICVPYQEVDFSHCQSVPIHVKNMSDKKLNSAASIKEVQNQFLHQKWKALFLSILFPLLMCSKEEHHLSFLLWLSNSFFFCGPASWLTITAAQFKFHTLILLEIVHHHIIIRHRLVIETHLYCTLGGGGGTLQISLMFSRT